MVSGTKPPPAPRGGAVARAAGASKGDAKRGATGQLSPRRKGPGGLADEVTDTRTQLATQSTPMAESVTDSTPYSFSDPAKRKAKKVIKLSELMAEDVTPLSDSRVQQIAGKASSPGTLTALQPAAVQDGHKVLEIVRTEPHESIPAEDIDPQLVFEGRKAPLNQEQFDKKHGFRRINLSIMRKLIYQAMLVGVWKRAEWSDFMKKRMPVLSWMQLYDWKLDFIKDFVNGLMLAILYIPQGLAYGMMVGVPPIYGIYTGIVGPIFYVVLGTSRHASTGAFAIVSLMVGSVVEQVLSAGEMLGLERTNTTYLCCSETAAVEDPMRAIEIASLVCFYVGIIQIVLGMMNAGLLAVWLSDQLVEGLTSGAAVHVLFSQIQSMTGMTNLPRTSDRFGILKFVVCAYNNFDTLSYNTTICSLICCFFLLYSKVIVDPVIAPWMPIKFPIELVVVVFSILLTWLSAGTPLDFNIQIIGSVQTGMTAPKMHDFRHTGDVLAPSFSIALVSFVIHIALAKLVAKKLNYQVNANQEWLALGTMHSASSFFGCFPGGSSLSRTMTSANLGTRSQLSSLVVTAVLLVVAFGAAPLFRYLPKPVLSCIVVIAMKDLYVKVLQSTRLFQQSFVDFTIFFVTFFSTVLINVNIGLMVGLIYALLSVVLRSQWAESVCMGRIPGTSDFKGMGHYRAAMEVPGIKVFRFDAPLYFANAELFVNRMHRATGLDPLMILGELKGKEIKKKKKEQGSIRSKKSEKQVDPLTDPEEDVELTVRRHCVQFQKPNVNRDEEEELVQLTHIVVDCSSFPYIDLMGVDALARAFKEYKSININVFFACCKVAVRQTFENTNFYDQVPKSFMFVSLSDAVSRAQYEQELRVQPSLGSPHAALKTGPIEDSLLVIPEGSIQRQENRAVSPRRSDMSHTQLGSRLERIDPMGHTDSVERTAKGKIEKTTKVQRR